MERLSRESINRIGITCIILGVLLFAAGFFGFGTEWVSLEYLSAAGIVAFILGSVLVLHPAMNKRKNFIGLGVSFGVALISVGVIAMLFFLNFSSGSPGTHDGGSSSLGFWMQSLGVIVILATISIFIFLSLLAINELGQIEKEVDQSKAWKLYFFGERSWERYLYWSMGILFIIIFVLTMIPSTADFLMDWNDALILAFLSIALGYLSDLRYRQFPDVRTD